MTLSQRVRPARADCSVPPFTAAGAASVWVMDGPAGLPAREWAAVGTLQDHDPFPRACRSQIFSRIS